MHYLAWVLAKDLDEIESLMAPYCEEYPEPRVVTNHTRVQKSYLKYLFDENRDYNDLSLKAFCEYKGYGYLDGDVVTSYNYDGFWDWHSHAGRWAGEDLRGDESRGYYLLPEDVISILKTDTLIHFYHLML